MALFTSLWNTAKGVNLSKLFQPRNPKKGKFRQLFLVCSLRPLDYVSGCSNFIGDIGKKLKRAGGVGGLPENLVWSYFIKICLGLNYLHKRRILHRDIKTYNIFLTENDNIRIGDLGVAKVSRDDINQY